MQQQPVQSNISSHEGMLRMIFNISLQLYSSVNDCLGPLGNIKLVTKSQQINNQEELINNENNKINIHLCSDAFSILNYLQVKHPIGIIIQKLIKNIYMGCGDGTISTLCLLTSFLKETLNLILENEIKIKDIIDVYSKLTKICVEEMKKKYAINVLVNEDNEPVNLQNLTTSQKGEILKVKLKLNEKLINELTYSTLFTKIGKQCEFLQKVCIQASKALYENLTIEDLKNLQFSNYFHNIHIIPQLSIKPNAFFYKGIIIEHSIQDIEMPLYLNNCKIIMLNNIPLDLVKNKKEYHFHSAEERISILKKEREEIDSKINKIIELGVNVVISNSFIDNISLNRFAKKGIIALRHVRQDLFDMISDMVGAIKLFSLDYPIKEEYIGYSDEIKIVNDFRQAETLIYIKGKDNCRCGTIVVSCTNKFNQERYIRAIKSTLKVLRNTFEDCLIIPGGGSMDMLLATTIRKLIHSDMSHVEESVYNAFSNALENAIPATLCKNAGFNVNQVVKFKWRKLCEKENQPMTIDFKNTSEFVPTDKIGLWDSLRVKIQCLHQVIETISTLIRLDAIIIEKDWSKVKNEKINSILSDLQQEEEEKKQLEEKINEDGSSETGFKSFAHIKKNKISETHKKKIIKKEKVFYSKEMIKIRKQIEERQELNKPTSIKQDRQQQERERKLKEKGLIGYSLDPFQQ
ncbi:hypothetical protein ABK040_009877 [Willaertia magna]